jgi:hypothetical protein
VREWRDVVLSDVGVSLPRGGSTKILPVFVFDAAGSGEAWGLGRRGQVPRPSP